MGYKLVIFPSTQTWVFAKAYEELCQRRRPRPDDGVARGSLHELRRRQRPARPRRVAVAVSAQDVYDARGFGGRQGAGERPAVVVVDFIEGFTNPESALACDADAAVEATRSLLDAARAASVPVLLHDRLPTTSGDLERAAMFIAKAPALATLRPGSPWVEVDARLGRRPDEPVLVKLFASAFFGTNLDELLRAAGLRHGDRRRRVDVRLRARDGRRRAPVRLPRPRAARGRRRQGGRRPQRLAARHRREVRRRDLDRRGDRGRRRARPLAQAAA